VNPTHRGGFDITWPSKGHLVLRTERGQLKQRIPWQRIAWTEHTAVSVLQGTLEFQGLRVAEKLSRSISTVEHTVRKDSLESTFPVLI